jgi:hypothetical protein
MRRCVLGVLLGALLLSACAPKAAVTIDGQELTLPEMGCYVAAVLQNHLDAPSDEAVRAEALSTAVRHQTIRDQAAARGLALTEDEQAQIDAQLADYVESVGGQESYEQELSDRRVSAEYDRFERYEFILLQLKLVESLYGPDGEQYPDDDAVRAYYTDNYFTLEYLLFPHIGVTGEPLSLAERQQQRIRAEELHSRALAGEPLRELAPQDYEGPETVAIGAMGDAVDSALGELEIGRTSRFVESDHGLYILRRLPDDPAYFAAHLEEIRSDYSWKLFLDLAAGWEQAAAVQTTAAFDTLNVLNYAMA